MSTAPQETIQQEYELADVERLQPHPQNPKNHDIDGIRESIRENGFVGVVVAQRSTGHILSGHGTLEAAIAEGFTQIPVMWADLDDEAAVRYLLAANRLSEKGGFNDQALAELLQQVAAEGNLAGTGYDADAVDDLLASLGTAETAFEDFDGDFSPTDDAAEARAQGQAATKMAQGLREVILVYPIDQWNEFSELIRDRRKATGLPTTSDVVLDALRS